jgi:hypothetical protein
MKVNHEAMVIHQLSEYWPQAPQISFLSLKDILKSEESKERVEQQVMLNLMAYNMLLECLE